MRDFDDLENEVGPKMQDREDQRDKGRRVRWGERGIDDNSREGSFARPLRLDEKGVFRPRKQRRRSRKIQDPGFADRTDWE